MLSVRGFEPHQKNLIDRLGKPEFANRVDVKSRLLSGRNNGLKIALSEWSKEELAPRGSGSRSWVSKLKLSLGFDHLEIVLVFTCWPYASWVRIPHAIPPHFSWFDSSSEEIMPP